MELSSKKFVLSCMHYKSLKSEKIGAKTEVLKPTLDRLACLPQKVQTGKGKGSMKVFIEVLKPAVSEKRLACRCHVATLNI